jgi:RNA-directed DNA polymerase
LFLHYAFDVWLVEQWPGVWFERYADDAIIHCVTLRQAEQVLSELTARMGEVGLTLHPDKTRIVYCRDDWRQLGYSGEDRFTFLGFEFRARTVKTKAGRLLRAFTPAISPKALKRLSRVVRSWRLHRRTRRSLRELAQWINPIIRGWLAYYGRHGRSELRPLLCRINGYLVRWARKKYRVLYAYKRVRRWWDQLVRSYPRGFAHWEYTTNFTWMR